VPPWAVLLAVAAVVGIVVIALADTRSEPFEPADPGLVAEGAVLYAANCAVCHGSDLEGADRGPPLLHAIYAPNHHGDEAFQRAVAAGVAPHHWGFGPMPPMPTLDRDEVAAIIAFIRAEQQAAGIIRDPTHP
jgi:mono/diheme cytochrome c family protein